ncbi:type IV pilin protein [Colwellia sp. TT2012]|uniref:type IV pilin protein n=1 Tax=Colwellia sp. TT2012 TaxID=1720342 RepID=UPI00070EBC14|nr:type IV pilin protein [Colwellia sp. TT2012]
MWLIHSLTLSGNYSIEATSTNKTLFTLTATAKKAQVKDTQCLTLTLNEVGQKGGTSSNCWEQ